MATPFQVEAWTEYAIGMLVLLIRIVYRTSIVGTNWEGDDYFAVIAVFFWTGELVMLELIGQYGSITGMNDALALTLSDQQKERIVIGSKCLVAGWVLYVTLIWCLKACMLFLYRRLTKIICTMWLCTGVFIIIATLLRCILCLQDAESINLGTIWSIRETFVGILAVNAPVLGPWIAKNASAVRSRASKNRSKTGGDPDSASHIVTIGAKDSTHRLERLGKDGRSLRGLGWTEIGNDSEERIMETQNDVSVSAKRSDEVVGNGPTIHVKTTFEVSRLA
ncbi:kinesin-like protein [Colletotrichum higginsianum]|nr:kinesin-like protein [Colletotrichum higginsianum]